VRDRWFVALVALCLASLGFFARVLVYPDLNLDYPFPGEDGLDWISNGLWWAGIDVRYTVRPPLLPWILAGLYRAGLLGGFSVLARRGSPKGIAIRPRIGRGARFVADTSYARER